MGLDVKVKNLIKFFVFEMSPPIIALVSAAYFLGVNDYFRFFGQLVITVGAVKGGISFYRRVLTPPKRPHEMGKWVIVTGMLELLLACKYFTDYVFFRS
jgi:hypothetical protein